MAFFRSRWEKLHKTEVYSFSSYDKYFSLNIIECFNEKILGEKFNSTCKYWMDKYIMWGVWKLLHRDFLRDNVWILDSRDSCHTTKKKTELISNVKDIHLVGKDLKIF